MEEQENLTPSQMLTLIQGLLVNNTRAIENLESAVTELDLSRDKSKDDLNSHYDRVCTMLNEVYKSSIEEIATQHDKKKEDLKRKKKHLTRSSLALVPELANLRSDGTDAYDAMRRCKQILAKLTEDVGLEKIDGRVSFNFIPKIGKLKLGFLQLCNNLPQDFTLRLLTPIMNIRLGQQIRCGIEGNFTAENVRHLEFGIRRDNDFVLSRNLGTEGKVFNFGFTADLGGVYVILACLFGNPIAHSPLTLTIHESGSRLTNDDVLASHIEVSADAIGLKASEEEDADKISSSVQDAGSVKASTKVVEGSEEKSSSMALEKSKPYQQIKDDRNTDFNRNRKESMIDGQDGQARINNNDLPGGRFKIGDSCVALGQDGIWYNGLIEASNSDGSFLIKFIDYGNSDNVAVADIVKSAPDIPDDVPDYDVDDHVGSRAAQKVLKDTTLGKNGKENPVQDLKNSNEDLYSNKKMENLPRTTLSHLDDLTVREIVEHLDMTDVTNLCSTSRSLNRLLHDMYTIKLSFPLDNNYMIKEEAEKPVLAILTNGTTDEDCQSNTNKQIAKIHIGNLKLLRLQCPNEEDEDCINSCSNYHQRILYNLYHRHWKRGTSFNLKSLTITVSEKVHRLSQVISAMPALLEVDLHIPIKTREHTELIEDICARPSIRKVSVTILLKSDHLRGPPPLMLRSENLEELSLTGAGGLLVIDLPKLQRFRFLPQSQQVVKLMHQQCPSLQFYNQVYIGDICRDDFLKWTREIEDRMYQDS